MKQQQTKETPAADTKSTYGKVIAAFDEAKKDPNIVGCIIVTLKPDGTVNIQTVQQNGLELLYMAKMIELHTNSGFQLEKKTK